MSARFFEAPDAWGDSCLWDGGGSPPMCVLSKFDLEDDYRDSLWPLIVEAVTSA